MYYISHRTALRIAFVGTDILAVSDLLCGCFHLSGYSGETNDGIAKYLYNLPQNIFSLFFLSRLCTSDDNKFCSYLQLYLFKNSVKFFIS